MISVIIPTHNRSEKLVRAIKSIQNQTRPVDEIIVVSDGSTDSTAEVMQEMCKEDSRINFIEYHPGVNGNHARNVGVENAKGEYIAFLDDDDEWYDYKIEKQMKVFEADEEIGLVYSGINLIYTDLKFAYCTKPHKMGDLSKDIFIHNDIACPGGVIIKADILKKTGMFDETLAAQQDYDLWIRIAQVAKIGYVYEPCLYMYNAIKSDQITSNTEKYIKAKNQVLDKYKEVIVQFDSEYQNKIYASAKMAIARRCMRNGEQKLARKYIVESLKMRMTKGGLALYGASFVPYSIVLRVRSKFNY